MSRMKSAKNLLAERDQYNKYYGDFRGVDLSSDHTQVHDQRFAYAVNMYKDYQSGQGVGIETIPGFRRRFETLSKDPVYGIHSIKYLYWWAATTYVHAGNILYKWPRRSEGEDLTEDDADVNVLKWGIYTVSDREKLPVDGSGIVKYQFNKPDFIQGTSFTVVGVYKMDGTDITANVEYNAVRFYLNGGGVTAGDSIKILYLPNREYAVSEGIESRIAFSEMNDRRSVSFVFNDVLYILDGKSYIYLDDLHGVGRRVKDDEARVHIPTTYINTIVGGANTDSGTEYEMRNMLSPLFSETFRADGEATLFDLHADELDGIEEVEVYGSVLSSEEYTVDLASGTVTFNEPPPKPEDAGFPQEHSGVKITARKVWRGDHGEPMDEVIAGCTVAAVYDDRVFLSGNQRYPTRVFWSSLKNPAYFPVLNYIDVGVGDSPVTAMMMVADTLMVLRGDTQSEGAVCYLSPVETGDDLVPIKYVRTSGLAGVGCLGPCINFLDDPVFVSRLGLEAMGQLSVRLERAIEHRSSLIDAALVNLPLEEASLAEWNGYLVLLAKGKMFLADSRQRFTHSSGVTQYEWYYLEDVGIWEGQYTEYKYAASMRGELMDDEGKPRCCVRYCRSCGASQLESVGESKLLNNCTCPSRASWILLPLTLASEGLRGEVVNPPDDTGGEVKKVNYAYHTVDGCGMDVFYHVRRELSSYSDEVIGYEALLCDTRENFTGGVFSPATTLAVIEGNLYFGTENGIVCSFNFDKRNHLGEIPKEYYSFDGRTIFCGCATKMDNCGIPHLTKNTVKKSTVIKTKTMQTTGAKIKVRTNRKPYEQVARISGGGFSFENLDFSDFTFITTEQNLYAIKEKEKKWVEKQYFLYSDEYLKPFSLYYIAYRYHVVGRYKESK